MSSSNAATFRFASACVALALSSTPGGAQAEEAPTRKPGLWELTTSLQGAPKTLMCVDAASEEKLNTMGKQALKDIDCSKRENHRNGDVYTSDSVCKLLGSTQTSHSVTTVVSDAEFTTEISSSFDPPLKYVGADSKTTQHGRWLGPCGPDMKPGDMMMNGQKLHPGAKP